jgi:hypothetical protein
MKENRLRTKLFQVWLHSREYEFLTNYAEKNMLSASETIRGWIHEVMKIEGHEITEPNNPARNRGGK